VSKGVCINRREPPKLGSAGVAPPCGRGVADPRNTPRHVLSCQNWSFF